MVGISKDPQTGNKINDQETKPGKISKARCVRTGCRLTHFLTMFVLYKLKVVLPGWVSEIKLTLIYLYIILYQTNSYWAI